MAFDRKPGTGRVWFPKKQSTNPRAPKFSGNLKTPDGKEWRVSVWEAQNKQSGAFDGFSLKLEEPQEQQGGQQGYQPQQAHNQAPQGYQPQAAPQQQAPQPQNGGYQPDDPGPQSQNDYGSTDIPY
jgi:hypothetical protein